MREHMGLYRGKRMDNGEWVEGFYLEFSDPITGIHERYIQTVKPDGRLDLMHRVDPDTVGECTGLTDKNGKLIFEGDILEREYLGEKHRYTVVYSREAFAWGEKNKYGLTGRLCKGPGTIEIIGNINDNPELVEEMKGENNGQQSI